MAERRHEGGVSYHVPGKDYFAKRELRRYAGLFSLWALGVAAVISGEFSGWNLGFNVGGWGGMFIATLIITIMYLGLTYSIAEMSPALPHTGGAYSFALTACGPWRCRRRGRSSRLRRRRRDRGCRWLGCGCRLAGRRLACRSFSHGGLARCALGCRLARRLLGARLSCRLTGACLKGTRLSGRCAATSLGLPSTRCTLLPTRSRSHGFCSDSAYCRPRPFKRTRTCTNHASTVQGCPPAL